MQVIGTSEWDARAIVAYAQIHNKNKFNKELATVRKWSDKKVSDYFSTRTFSLNSKNPSNILRKSREFQNNVIAANIVNNNFPNIKQLAAEDIKGTNLLTYSFPCQGLSIANMGRAKGIKPNSNSTSNLIWEIKRLLDDVVTSKNQLPKYLLMENVKTLIGEKHKADYKLWKKYLSSIGYETYTFVLHGHDHNNLQKRSRVFAISILRNYKKISLTEDKIAETIKNEYGKKLSILERKKKYLKILSSSSEELINLSIPNDTPSRQLMANENIDLVKEAKKRKYMFNTLTTKQDRHPNIGMITLDKKISGKLHKRFITPKEAYMIMGFTSNDFDKVFIKYKEQILTKETLYRQAGNSIVVQVLESIFKFIIDIERGIYD